MGRNNPQKEDFGREAAEGEVIGVLAVEEFAEPETETVVRPKESPALSSPKSEHPAAAVRAVGSGSWLRYIVGPFILLTVALFGGLRLGAGTNEFVFLRPHLICLIFAAVMLTLFFRAKLIRLDYWFSGDLAPLQQTANAAVILTLFAATTQIFNSLLPEQGLPFWIIAFFFFWSLWTNLFAEFNPKKLLTSLGSIFGLAFVVKYLVLSSLTATGDAGFVRALFSGNLTKETITYLLDLPRFSAGTGYIQFFTLALYLLGLVLMSPKAARD